MQERLKSQESDHSRDNDGCVSHRSRVVVAETSESETALLSEVGQTTMLRTSITLMVSNVTLNNFVNFDYSLRNKVTKSLSNKFCRRN